MQTIIRYSMTLSASILLLILFLSPAPASDEYPWPEEYTILELAQSIIDLTGSRSKIIHTSLPTDDPRQRQPDISLAKSLLGWQPQTSLKTGLSKTIAYFDQVLQSNQIQETVIT